MRARTTNTTSVPSSGDRSKELVAVQTTTLNCPVCHAEFELSAALAEQVNLRFGTLVDERVAAAAKAERERAQRELGDALASKGTELEVALGELRVSRQRELELARRERAMTDREQQLALEGEQRLKGEIERVRAAERERLGVEARLRETELVDRITALSADLKASRDAEVQLRKAQAEAEDLKQGLELEVQRRLNEARRRDAEAFSQREDLVVQQALENARNEHALALQQKQIQVDRLSAQIAGLQRGASPPAPELQGESLEVRVRDLLRQWFPGDEITDVARGRRGGDITQLVRTPSLQRAGTIVWETKNAANWNDAWTTKLLDDLRAACGDVAVIVTTILPKGIELFGLHRGVWVTGLASLQGLAVALRSGVLRIAAERSAAEGVGTRLGELFEYLTSTQFSLHVQAVLSSVQAMLADLDAEQAAVQRLWTKRRRQIQRLSENAASIVGGIESITSRQLAADERHLLDVIADEQPPPTNPA